MSRIVNIKNKFLELWSTLELDAVLAPMPMPAMKHNANAELYPAFAYCKYFNILDCPVGAVPVTKVRNNEQSYPVNNEAWTRAMHESMKGSVNLPISVQVVARPYREETCLNLMKQIEDGVNCSFIKL